MKKSVAITAFAWERMNSDHDGPDLAVHPQPQLAELSGCRGPPGRSARGLGPTAGYAPAVPSQHGGGLHDQEHLSEAFPAEHLAQHTQDGSVRVIKNPLWHLALQHQKLTTLARISASRRSPPASSKPTRASTRRTTNTDRNTNGDHTAGQPPDQHRRISGTLTITCG